MMDRNLHSFRAPPLARAFTAYGSLSAPQPRVIAAYGSSLITEVPWVEAAYGSASCPKEPQGFAAYGYYCHLGLRQILVAVTETD